MAEPLQSVRLSVSKATAALLGRCPCSLRHKDERNLPLMEVYLDRRFQANYKSALAPVGSFRSDAMPLCKCPDDA